MRTRLTTIGALSLLLVVFGACGGADPTPATAGVDAFDEPTTSEPVASHSASSGGSPLEQLVGAPINDEEAMNRFYQQLEEEAQIATSECMLQQGFTFQPTARIVSPMEQSGLPELSLEFAQRFGFGIAVDFVDFEFGSLPDEEAAFEKQLAGMTEAERDAYETALFGEPADLQDDTDRGSQQWGGGCYGTAYEATFAKSPDRVFDLLESEASVVISQFYADPRMLTAQKDYAACMLSAGYEYETQDKLKASIAAELGEIISDAASFTDPLPLSEQGEIGMGWNNESVEFRIAGNTLTVEAEALVDELAQKELTLAVANLECATPLRETELAVQFEYEQILVDQLGDQVRAILGE